MKVLILSTIEGHASMAEALSEFLTSKGHQVEVFSYPDPALAVYRIVYRKAPVVMKLVYDLMQLKLVENIVRWHLAGSYKQILLPVVSRFAPDCIVSVNYGFDPCIERFRDVISQPYVNVLADPKTFYPLSLSVTANVNAVFDTAQQQQAARIKPAAVTKVVGWLVRPQFKPVGDIQEKKALRKKLKLDPEQLTFLFTTGSEGTETIIKLLEKLQLSQVTLQIVVACGSNKQLLQKIKHLNTDLTKSNISLVGLPFTRQLHLYMQTADLVVGKAGPNTIFEAVATHTPFMATTHINGLEDGNIELIQAYGLGYVIEETNQAVEELGRISHSPHLLNKFQPQLRKMAAYNAASTEKVYELLTTLTEQE